MTLSSGRLRVDSFWAMPDPALHRAQLAATCAISVGSLRTATILSSNRSRLA
jgi:hypothetical protein